MGPKSLQKTEIDQRIDQGVDVGDGVAIAEHRAFNAKGNCLTIDSFGGGALVVNFFVDLALPVERIAEAGTNAGRHGNRTTALASAWVVNGARLLDKLGFGILGKEWADMLAAFVFDDCHGTVGVSEQKWHSEPRLTNW